MAYRNDKFVKEKTSYSTQIVCFKLGNEEYGIDILKVQEIQKMPKITLLPKAADFIMGVIDLRGKVMPIIDLSKRFGIEGDNTTEKTRAIIVNIKDKKIGLAIDSVSHVIKVDSADVEPPPPIVKGISGKYIVGIAKVDDDFIVILDIDRIFVQNELKALEAAAR